MVPQTYDIVTVTCAGAKRPHKYTTDEDLRPGAVLRLAGRYWLVSGPATDAEGDEPNRVLDGRVFASVGSPDDEADPDAGHGWMCRLLDSSVLAAAGFARVRKAELLV